MDSWDTSSHKQANSPIVRFTGHCLLCISQSFVSWEAERPRSLLCFDTGKKFGDMPLDVLNFFLAEKVPRINHDTSYVWCLRFRKQTFLRLSLETVGGAVALAETSRDFRQVFYFILTKLIVLSLRRLQLLKTPAICWRRLILARCFPSYTNRSAKPQILPSYHVFEAKFPL
uniref:Uncharacterized protein n=1 Tax=Tetraselmis sp. GSL018 TaxID=582737 RepID=A0A061RZ54_9CHLO